jgi:hypothetical protein
MQAIDRLRTVTILERTVKEEWQVSRPLQIIAVHVIGGHPKKSCGGNNDRSNMIGITSGVKAAALIVEPPLRLG